MASRFQAAALVASPSYPNAVAWSDENLLAVASGHLVTILNPAMPFGPRGLITISASKPFSIGLIESKDLLSGSLLPICLTHDVRPGVRSISWSPIGLSTNSGCLLAVCTTEGRVMLYRLPFCEFSAEWVEVMDISEMLYTYLANINYGELNFPSLEYSDGQASKLDSEHGSDDDLPIAVFRKKHKRRRKNALAIINKESGTLRDPPFCSRNSEDVENSLTLCTEVAVFSCSLLQEGSSIEVLIVDGNQRVWVAGKLHQLDGSKALVNFPETDGNGNQDKWVEINPFHSNGDGSNIHNEIMAGQDNCFPVIRPSMDVGNFPEQILSASFHGADDILKIGQTVETWINHRWVEGVLMGLKGSSLEVKLNGDTELVMIDTRYVRSSFFPAAFAVQDDRMGSNALTVIWAASVKSNNPIENNQLQIVSMPNSKSKKRRQTRQNYSSPYITADKYASRSAMLSSLIVAWSPILEITSDFQLISQKNLLNCCSILAVGAKSGQISFWRIYPQCYSIVQSGDPTFGVLIGLQQAHNSWITAINWAFSVSDPSNPQLLLATGSSDGSVKIWQGYIAELLNSSEDNHASFSLLKEVISVDSVPISVLSLIVPAQSPGQLLLAVGKGSGSLEVWICDLSAHKFDKAGSYDAHDHIVTGLSWAFNGSCLYSCSQDDSVHSWILQGSTLCQVPMPSNTPGVKSSADVPNVFDSCYGLAVSPGNLVLAVARRFDAFLLNPMYQARAQKAAVEFFWIGGQKIDILSNRNPDFDMEVLFGFDRNELVYWEHNILWSLNYFENPNRPLVIWDIIAALLAFNDSAPKYVNHMLSKWLISYVGPELGHSPAKMTNLTSRQLQLLNVISRRVVLEEGKEEKVNSKKLGECAFEEEEQTLWREILESSEKELRERLVSFNFGAVIDLISRLSTNFSKSSYWVPVGLAQMEQWVAKNHGHVRDHLKHLASKVRKLEKSKLTSISVYLPEEQCTFCSATLPFESPEEAFCRAVSCNGGASKGHRLARCSVSMQVCPLTPSWFCVCCHRRASKLAPHTLLSTPKYPRDLSFHTKTNTLEVSPKPFCPFCGILLQRLQPEFLLSASPV
ncbi:hypothetical protein LguiA_031745 [Lonicera macranthoides]